VLSGDHEIDFLCMSKSSYTENELSCAASYLARSLVESRTTTVDAMWLVLKNFWN